MLSYDALCRHPAAFPSLTGLTRAEFESLAVEFEVVERNLRSATSETRRDRKPRRNAHGAGHPYHNDACSHCSWPWSGSGSLRLTRSSDSSSTCTSGTPSSTSAPSWKSSNALGTFPFDRPGRDRTKLRSPAEVMAAFPQVSVIIDAKEQRINRPEGFEAQKPYYSGKKKAHTLKTQVVVDRAGGSRR